MQDLLWHGGRRARSAASDEAKWQPGPSVHDDLVERDVTADGPNRLWLADIEHRAPSRRGQAHLRAIKDVWSNRIVGYSIDSRMDSRLVVNAVRTAVAATQLTSPQDTRLEGTR
ncbi:transposase InsO family protein [Kibdelosporangium phytohabitans]|nr:transposase InsO family protein [Kibdelosporangium phytohabitans]